MRLLHVKDLRLEEFFGEDVPRYAILSHRWGGDEVSYQDFMGGLKKDGVGYRKIVEFCKHVAADMLSIDIRTESKHFKLSNYSRWKDLWTDDWVWVDTLDWVWIDTCCIDKSSSSELSEAINSMYHWYSESTVCYAYLSDVNRSNDIDHTLGKLRSSQWFIRGWTLQELLAPQDLVLLDKNWKELGTRSSLLVILAETTSIAEKRLESSFSFKEMGGSVAEMFSWAARRKTTRTEDATYCLLGLFNINMPLLYGERNNAFLRLQQEIIRSSNDESIFVWSSLPGARRVLVAGSPARFESKYSTQTGEFSKVEGLQRPPYAVTNQGLQLHVPTILTERSSFLLPLNCQHYEGYELKGAYAINLEKDVSGGVWTRSSPLYGLDELSQDDAVYLLDDKKFSGLYIVPITWVWSLNDLASVDSTIIYARIQ